MTVPLSGPQMLALVSHAVALVCEVDPVTLGSATSLIGDLAADSVALVEIIEVTEESLRAHGSAVAFDDGHLADLATIGDIVGYIVGYIREHARDVDDAMAAA